MCGLNFIYSKSLHQEEMLKRIEHSLNAIRHRGPDDEGIWKGSHCVAGHVRLSIIDLHDSHQPMTDPTSRYTLVFNGEIYNYQSLRHQLADKWAFRTSGDTETILAGLVIHGQEFIEKMEGMWAFIFWDNQNKEMIFSRDRMGEKPLYFEQINDGINLASTLPALVPLSEKQWEEDINSTADYLRYGNYLPGTTAYKNVFEALPGHFYTWSLKNNLNTHKYWNIDYSSFQGTYEQARNELKEKFINAVKSRMVADVEVGAFLSGGVDSSLVTALSKDLTTSPLSTFTIGFEDKSFDEREYARMVASEIGTNHHEDVLKTWDKSLLIDLVFNHVGQPFYDQSILPTAMVSKLASQHVKVSLSGDGGDELFCGYQRYQARNILRWYTRLPHSLRKNVNKLIRSIPEPMSHHSRSLIKKAHLFVDIEERIESETPYVSPVFYSNKYYNELFPELAGCGHSPPGIPEETKIDSVFEMMVADSLVYLPQDILVKVDRASMAYSLESRAPFLDSSLVSFAFSLPRKWHRRWFTGKRLLKDTFFDILPSRIWNRRKQGFGVPIHQWFRQGLETELTDLLMNTQNIPINSQPVITMITEHKNHKRDHGYRLWSLYIYLLWRNQQKLTTS